MCVSPRPRGAPEAAAGVCQAQVRHCESQYANNGPPGAETCARKDHFRAHCPSLVVGAPFHMCHLSQAAGPGARRTALEQQPTLHTFNTFTQPCDAWSNRHTQRRTSFASHLRASTWHPHHRPTPTSAPPQPSHRTPMPSYVRYALAVRARNSSCLPSGPRGP